MQTLLKWNVAPVHVNTFQCGIKSTGRMQFGEQHILGLIRVGSAYQDLDTDLKWNNYFECFNFEGVNVHIHVEL